MLTHVHVCGAGDSAAAKVPQGAGVDRRRVHCFIVEPRFATPYTVGIEDAPTIPNTLSLRQVPRVHRQRSHVTLSSPP
jgi:pyocin large subunit-like protein